MSIPFTDRELKRAWRQLEDASKPQDGKRKNTHRLLLFYAVECGLKAVWLKRTNKTLFTTNDITQTGHDLAKIMAKLSAGNQFKLPKNIQLKSVKEPSGGEKQRSCNTEGLHQVWRYGGTTQSPTDEDCEKQLEQVMNWIRGELR